LNEPYRRISEDGRRLIELIRTQPFVSFPKIIGEVTAIVELAEDAIEAVENG
jgi:hypothetical protein